MTPLFVLQSGFKTLQKEKVDLKERVENLELLFIRLSGETDTMSERGTRARQEELQGGLRVPSVSANVVDG